MKGNRLTIAVMFGMVFMVGFVTMFTGPLAAVVKAQFGASNALSQFGSSANFLAYLFMGIPCGMVLKRKGYRFTSLAAVSVGILGVALQILAGFVASFGVYVTGDDTTEPFVTRGGAMDVFGVYEGSTEGLSTFVNDRIGQRSGRLAGTGRGAPLFRLRFCGDSEGGDPRAPS